MGLYSQGFSCEAGLLPRSYTVDGLLLGAMLCNVIIKVVYEVRILPLPILEIHVFISRGRSRAAATSKMDGLVIIVNGWKSLTIITKHSILDVTVALDPSLIRFTASVPLFTFSFLLSTNL